MSKFDLSLVDLKGISKPLTKLIESVSKGIGELYRPVDTVIQAHADAKALLILEEAKGKKAEIAWRATARLNFLELRRQKNIDSIVKNAIDVLPSSVSKENVDEDWIASFFDFCKDIGDERMQQIWGKILAGEVETPGCFSRRTLSLLKTLTKQEAEMFTKMCSFIFKYQTNDYYFVVPHHEVFEYIRNNGMTTEEETHLKNIGLLSTECIHFVYKKGRTDLHVQYFNEDYVFHLPKKIDSKKAYDIQSYPLTQAGNEIVSIAGGKANPGFIKLFVKNAHPRTGIILKQQEKK